MSTLQYFNMNRLSLKPRDNLQEIFDVQSEENNSLSDNSDEDTDKSPKKISSGSSKNIIKNLQK